jgi:hypothetical protein
MSELTATDISVGDELPVPEAAQRLERRAMRVRGRSNLVDRPKNVPFKKLEKLCKIQVHVRIH